MREEALPMMNRFRSGWSLLLASFGVIGRNKGLLLFPATTGMLTILIAALVLTPIALQPTGHAFGTEQHWQAVGSRLWVVEQAPAHDRHSKTTAYPTPLGLTLGIGLYFLSMFLATFFNVAFVHAVFNALKGQPVSVTEALGFAASKTRSILMWSLFAGMIGYAIKLLEEKFGFIGAWVVRMVGLAWSVAAVFVVPTLVLEDDQTGPIELIRKSASLLKRTWGESVGGYVGLQVIGSVAALSGVIFFLPAIVGAVFFNMWMLMVVSMLLWLGALIVFGYMSSVASQVYLCVLYLHATTGFLPEGFTADHLSSAWKLKKA
jgi:hypothetical protein